MENSFLTEFKKRDYFNQCTNSDELEKVMSENKIRGYIGFDCTAPSLHVGSLLQIMCLRLMQKHGHRPIVLIGGGTTRIGDPSGKDKTRKILTEEEIKFLAEILYEAWFSLDVRNMSNEKRKMYSSIKSKISRLNNN